MFDRDLSSTLNLSFTRGQSWFINNPSKYLCMLGGYGSGKTFAFVLIAWFLAHCLYTDFNEKTSWILAEPTETMSEKILIPTLDMMRDILKIDWEWVSKRTRQVRVWGWGMETRFFLLSAFNYESWRGVNGPTGYPIAGGGIDEAVLLPHEKAWGELIGRGRGSKYNKFWLTSNPPDLNLNTAKRNSAWVFNTFEKVKGILKPNHDMYFASTYENDKLADTVGYAQNLIDTLGPTLALIYVFGKRIDGISGRLFWGLNETNNVVNEDPYPINIFDDMYLVFDFNNNPATALECYFKLPKNSRDGKKVLYVRRTFKANSMNTRPFVRFIIPKIKNHRGRILIDGDPSGKTTTSSTETDKFDNPLSNYYQIMDELKNNKINKFTRVKKIAKIKAPSITGSAEAVNAAFEKRRLIINSRNIELIRDLYEAPMMEHEYHRWKGNNPERSHYADELRYIVNTLMPLLNTKYLHRNNYYQNRNNYSRRAS